MKGVFFQKPLEFKLEVQGELWSQGDPVMGTLVVKNQGNSPASASAIRVELAVGELKKVRQKSADAFKSLASAVLTTAPSGANPLLDPQKELVFPWRFETDRNCQITDSSASLFVLYGQADASEKLGQLQLIFQPYSVILEFLQILQIGFRFVVKSTKSSKGSLEAKLTPPDSKAFATVEQLVLLFHFDGDVLEVDYGFSVKKVEASAAAFDIKKGKRAFQQRFAPEQYRVSSGRFNHEKMEPAIREIVAQVESKILF